MLARLLMVLVLMVSGLLAGCGQKGPLYREAPTPQGSAVSAAEDDAKTSAEREREQP